MKYIFLTFLLLISTSSNALKAENKYEIKINEVLNKIEIEQERNIEKINIQKIFQEIDKNKSYTEYKKELLKANIILFYQSIFMAENKNDLLLIAKESFPVSLCTAFQFQNNTTNVLNQLLSQVLNTSYKIEKYNKSAKFLYSNEIMKKLESFMPKNVNEIQKNCIQSKTYPLN